MRTIVSFLFLGASLLAQGVKDRKPETIDYTTPARYAKLPKSAGATAGIRVIAKPLRDENGEQTLRRIHAFIASKIPHTAFGGWGPDHHNFDDLVLGFDHRGCASHALVFCNLARACGLPAVYVKSSRHEWIRKYVSTGETGDFSGHVFLEVFLDGKWKLVDAQGMRIWDAYDPSDPE